MLKTLLNVGISYTKNFQQINNQIVQKNLLDIVNAFKVCLKQFNLISLQTFYY